MLKLLRYLLLLTFGLVSSFLAAQSLNLTAQLREVDWHRQRLGPKLVWEYHHFNQGNLFGANQFINILRIGPKARRWHFALGSGDRQLVPTSMLAEQHQAVAALNGTFFDTRNGGSVDFIRIQGKILDTTRYTKLPLAEHQRSALVVRQGNLHIVAGDSLPAWERRLPDADVMVSGPLLLLDGKSVPLAQRPFNQLRHPRSAVGRRPNGEVLWITVDGRTKEAAGMSLFELTQLFQALGCTDAINLDGGGSTTMWIAGQRRTGVVNHPCDDKVFDEYGERPVSNVLLLQDLRGKK